MTDSKTDKTKLDLGLLEEDDEFEEFPAKGENYLDSSLTSNFKVVLIIYLFENYSLKV